MKLYYNLNCFVLTICWSAKNLLLLLRWQPHLSIDHEFICTSFKWRHWQTKLQTKTRLDVWGRHAGFSLVEGDGIGISNSWGNCQMRNPPLFFKKKTRKEKQMVSPPIPPPCNHHIPLQCGRRQLADSPTEGGFRIQMWPHVGLLRTSEVGATSTLLLSLL